MKIKPLVLLAISAVLGGCASTPYSQRDSVTTQLGDNTVRYGSVAAMGAGGYFAGKEIGGSTSTGVAGAVVGTGVGYAVQKAGDAQKQRAYAAGLEDGANQARAEQLEDQWKREAVYNAPGATGSNPAATKYRQIYVPSYSANGVTYPGEYQQAEVSR